MNPIQWNNLLISNLVTESQSVLDVLDEVPSANLKSAEQTSLPLLVRQLLEHRAVLTELLTKTVFQKEARLFDEMTESNLPEEQKSAITQLLSSLRQETKGQSKVSQQEIRPSQQLPLMKKNQEQTPAKERPPAPQEMESIKKQVTADLPPPPSEKKEIEQKLNPAQSPLKDPNLPKQSPPILQNAVNKQPSQESIVKTNQKAPESQPAIEQKTNKSSVRVDTKEETSNLSAPLRKNDQQLPVQKQNEPPIYHELRETAAQREAHANRNMILKSETSLLAKAEQEAGAVKAAHIRQEERSEAESNGLERFPIIIPYPGSSHSIESRSANRKKKDPMEEDPEEFSQDDDFDEN